MLLADVFKYSWCSIHQMTLLRHEFGMFLAWMSRTRGLVALRLGAMMVWTWISSNSSARALGGSGGAETTFFLSNWCRKMPHLDPFRPMIFQWKPQRDRISQLAMFNYRRINWSVKTSDFEGLYHLCWNWGLFIIGLSHHGLLWFSCFDFFLESIPGVGAVAMTVRSCVSRSYWCLPCTTAEVPLKNVKIDLTRPALLIWMDKCRFFDW